MEYKSKCNFLPSQLEISITEKCNQDCDYCWVDKRSRKVLSFSSIKKCIDIFLALPLDHQTITFTTNEPFMHPVLYKDTVEYIYSKRQSNKDLTLVTTTNGLNLTKDVISFLLKCAKKEKDFRLNISLDGEKESHDAHRVLANKLKHSAFSVSLKNFLLLPKDFPRVIFTITPSEADKLNKNIDFILNQGFKKIDIFPQVFTLWRANDIKSLSEELGILIDRINNSSPGYNLRTLNRLWGSTHYNKLLMGSDEKFYLFEWILTLPSAKREEFVIGDLKKGIDWNKRGKLFTELFQKVALLVKGRCDKCKNRNLCGLPLPLYMRCHYKGLDFKKYFDNFCSIASMLIEHADRISPDVRNNLDCHKLKNR